MTKKRIKILVIDDNSVNLLILVTMIKYAFPEAITLTASNGKNGFEIAVTEDPDIILLDILMPEMNGYEVCKNLKADKKLCDIPVLFVTALKDTKENRIQALESGGEAFLTKPIDEVELTAQIRAMLKIRNANIQKRNEKELLIKLVAEKTRKLNKSYKSTLKLLQDLKRENDARSKSEERFKIVAETAGEWIWEVDNEGMYTYSSPMVEKILGYTFDEIVGKKYFYDFFNGDVNNLLSKEIFTVFKQKQVFKDFENQYSHKNGQIVHVNTSGSPILDNDGNLIGYRGVDRDVTELKKYEARLLKLSHAIEQSPVSIIITDKDGFIEYGNSKVTEVTGYSLEELIGKNTRIFNSGENPISEYYTLWDTISSGKDWYGVFHNKKKNGELYWESGSISPIKNEAGEITHFVAVKEDITQRKLAEEELVKAKQRAEQSDRLKTAFMNNISHEIRTPLNGILGCAPFILEPNISQEDKEMYLMVLNKSGSRLMDTVTNYMDISLIVSGNMEVCFQSLDISLTLTKTYNHFKELCLQKEIELKLNLPKNIGNCILISDDELVLKILNHLVDNAIKFTQKGSVEIGCNIKTIENSDYIELYVNDTGQGISNEAQLRIFDEFTQENISTTRGHEGSGLGLSIAKGITILLGGKIHLESIVNIGTTVFVTLPIKTKTSTEKAKTDSFNSIGENFGTVLIAEDDEINYFFIETMLKSSFGKILKAENGQEAVDLCRTHPEIELVLMDIKMPVLSGLEATKIIKLFRADLPIIAVTALALTGDEYKFREAGCDDYISKPFIKSELLLLLQKYFKRKNLQVAEITQPR